MPVLVGLDLDVHFVAEYTGQQLVVEFPLYGPGILGVENEFANAGNGGSGDKDGFAIELRGSESLHGWCRSLAQRWPHGVRSQ